ncbi:MAG: radical SAM protein, partial [Spirochaetaceae bacterium]|nr:radical SAM protein [Spirochaetaceae bacterium]
GRLAEKTFVQVELGFQTADKDTAKYIRRGFDNSVYLDAVERLHKANPKIHVVTHVIFGLPGETPEQMMNTVQTVVDSGADGIKITCLYVLKDTDLELEYRKGSFSVLEENEYYTFLECALKLIPPKMVIHRLTGDPPKRLLVAPLWTTDKKRAVNRIRSMLAKS